MATVRRELRIDRPAETVWKVVGRADILHLWFPGIVGCTVETVDGRTTRVITMGSGLPMTEEIITDDPIQRRFQYRITASTFRHHLGTIDVIELDASSCLVVYSTDAVPDAMALVIGGATGGALDELARQFATGSGPALAAVGLEPAPQSAPREA